MPNIVEILFKQTGAEKVASETGKMTKANKALASSALKYTAFGAAGILAVGKKLIDLYGVQELAETNLRSALGHTNDELLNQASALQKVSKFGDEQIIAMQALASNMGIGEDQIAATTEMAIGLAEALNLDLNLALKAAAGAIQGDTKMLTRYIPLLKDTTDESEKLAIVQKVANKGLIQSAEAAKTVAGQMNQASMAIGDVGEALGEAFAEPVRLAAAGVTWLAESFVSFLDGFRQFDEGTLSAEQRLEQLDILVKEHADTSVPDLIDSYTTLGMGYDANLSRSENFIRLLDEQEDAQSLVMVATKLSTEATNLDAIATGNLDDKAKSLVRTKKLLSGMILEQVELQKAEAGITNDLRTDIDKWIDTNEASIDSMAKGAIMMGNLGDASRALANQYIVEGVYGAVKSALGSVPFPFNIALAAGAGLAANALFNEIVPARSAATGLDEVFDRPTLIEVGDTRQGERVQIGPDGGDAAGMGSINITINSPITYPEFTRDVIIPEIREALRLGI